MFCTFYNHFMFFVEISSIFFFASKCWFFFNENVDHDVSL